MTGQTLPGIGLTGDWALGEDGWDAGMNDNLLTLSTLTSLTVVSRATQMSEFSTDGTIAIVPSGELANKIAVRFNGSWRYMSPKVGALAYVIDEKVHVFYNGSGWYIDGADVDVLKFMLPDGDMGAALTRAASYARQHGKHTLVCGPGKFKWLSSADLTFDGSRDPFTDGTLHLIGAGEQTTLFEVDLTEPFPALDCVGNTRFVLRDFRMFHSTTCLSTASIFCAKPGGHPFGVGREPRLENVSVIRPRNLSGPCFDIMACDLASLRACEGHGRQPLRWGSYAPPGLATVGGVYPRGTLSKFQAVDPTPDYTAMYTYDTHLWGTDYCLDNWGGSGSRLYTYGGYWTLFGGPPAPVNGTRGHLHMRSGGVDAGHVRMFGTRFELGGDTGVIDAVIVAHGNLGAVLHCDPDCDAPLVYVPPGVVVSAPEVRIFSAISGQPIFSGPGTVTAPQVIANRSMASVSTLVREPTLLGSYADNVLGAPGGDRRSDDVFRPGLAVGSNGAGFLTWENLRKYGPLLTMRVGYRGFDFGSTAEVAGQNQTISPTSPTEYGTPGTAGYYAGGEGYGAAGGDVYLSGGWSDLGPSGYGLAWITSGYGNKIISKFEPGSGNWSGYLVFKSGANETGGGSSIGTTGNGLVLSPASGLTSVNGALSVGYTSARKIELYSASAGSNPTINATGGQLQLNVSGLPVVTLTQVVNATNRIDLRSSASGGAVVVSAQGESNIDIAYVTAGSGQHVFYSGSAVCFTMSAPGGAVNYAAMRSSSAGNPVLITADGSDANIDIRVVPKNAGLMRFGTHTATSDTAISGYITIKDSGGVVRKLAVIT